MTMNTEIIINSKSDRRLYSREDMHRYFCCPKEIPQYLLQFPEILNDDVNEDWYKKPLPKFDEITEAKHRPAYVANKFKARPMPSTNQYGDANDTTKYRPQQKPTFEKYNRYNVLNDSQTSTINKSNDNEVDGGWQTVESKPYKVPNLSKQYGSNNPGQENHWKKWSKDRNPSGDNNKPSTTFNRTEKTNNFVVRKVENIEATEPQSPSVLTGQTEDIWQDDWDTEMQSQIATSRQESLESYDLPPPYLSTLPHTDQIDYNQWFYEDLANKVQGPFHSDKMANLLATGHFDYSTSIRRQCDEKFLLLAEYRVLYGRIPFTAGPSIASILRDTVVDINPLQLAAGVDRVTLEKILTNATSLSSKISPTTLENNAEIEKQALLDEKKQLEERKAELEKERVQFLEEQAAWKLRMEKEMEEKMKNLFIQQTMELNKTISDMAMKPEPKIEELLTPVSIESSQVDEVVDHSSDVVTAVIFEEKIELPIISTATETKQKKKSTKPEISAELREDLNSPDWMSMKDLKNNKKNKKSKNKLPVRQSPEPVPIVANDTAKADKVIHQSGSIRIVEREIVADVKPIAKTLESPKAETAASWNVKPTMVNVDPSKPIRSLLEIQAEEAKIEKKRSDTEKALNRSKDEEANKATSFKELLLKGVKPAPVATRAPLLPPGKSIWDMVDSDPIVAQPIMETKPTRDNNSKKMKKPSENYEKTLLNESNSEELLTWCRVKLTKFNKDLDVITVLELLKHVADENVAELTKELLDDSTFTRNFAKDFVKKRDELKKEEEWQTVKKTGNNNINNSGSSTNNNIVTNNNNNNNNGNNNGNTTKNKKKKKMVVIDHIKFRSS